MDSRPVELELKYRVVDPEAGTRLLAAEALGTYRASGPARTTQNEDHYVDTPDAALGRAGFAARFRQSGGSTLISLKSLNRATGALHRRDELEGPADRGVAPIDWPASPARSLVLELCGDAPLVELVTVRQLRRKRRYEADGSEVELSLDDADVVDGGRILDHFTELEIELIGGDPAPLEALAPVLDTEAGLRPSIASKLEAAMAAAGIPLGIPRPAGVAVAASDAAAPAASGEAAPKQGEDPSLASPPEGGSEGALLVDGSGLTDTEDLPEPATHEPDDGEVVPHRRRRPRHRHRHPAPGAAAVTAEVPAAEGGGTEPTVTEAPATSLAVGKSPGVRADDTVAEAGRKVLRFHFARMLAKESGTRSGEDVEDLHGMRVATRRMRAAWRVFGTAYRPTRTRRYVRDLREIASRLGAVRDLDVQIEGLEHYRATVGSEAERAGIQPLVDSWERRRDDARVALLSALDSGGYRRFVEEYRDFVLSDGLGVMPVAPTQPHRIRDTMPSRIWSAYEHVRAYEPVLRWADVETLHELRIAAKWLRYTVEFVREPLGADANPLIERIVALQDHLGLLHDADVAASLARAFLVEHAADLDDRQTAAIARYLMDRERERSRLRRTIGLPWRRISGTVYRRALARVLADL